VIGTYSQLQAAIADFLLRQDLTATIPTFIRLAEAQIARDLRDWRMEKRSVFAFDDGLEDLPADWIETIRVQVVGSGEVRHVGHSEMMDLKRDTQLQGEPYYFTHQAGKLELYPIPNAEGELVYFSKVPALSDAEPTNWLLTDAPDVYLYGALIHSAPFLQEDERIQVWSQLYAAAVGNLNKASERARNSGPLRMRVKTYG
jgi:hypothetical protein